MILVGLISVEGKDAQTEQSVYACLTLAPILESDPATSAFVVRHRRDWA